MKPHFKYKDGFWLIFHGRRGDDYLVPIVKAGSIDHAWDKFHRYMDWPSWIKGSEFKGVN